MLGLPGFVDPEEEGFCDDVAIAEAIRYAADNGAKIINISIGAPGAAPIYLDALRYAVERGVFVAIAAGNDFDEGNPVIYPAAYAADIQGVVAVGAIGRSKRRARYSTTGSYVELAAPGGDSSDGGSSGFIWQMSLFFPDFTPGQVVRPRFDRYAEIGSEGTSMAAPHAAGVAALLYSQGVTKPEAIEAALKHFATDLGATGRDNEYGHGLIDARASLRGMGLAR
jgi:serine protease